MFGVVDELRTRLQIIDERQESNEKLMEKTQNEVKELRIVMETTCNNVAELQTIVHETQELVIKCMNSLKQTFNQLKQVCNHMNENIEDIEPGFTPWVWKILPNKKDETN